jgi:ferritin-like metal-binding protein YciE
MLRVAAVKLHFSLDLCKSLLSRSSRQKVFSSTSMKQTSFHELFLSELRDIYDAEHRILDTLPKLAELAANAELKQAFRDHEAQTRVHTERLMQIFDMLSTPVKREQCQGMKGILEEGMMMLKKDMEPAVRDALLIAGAQKVEHYEITSYGTLRSFAEIMGHDDVVPLLQQTLDEESHANELLNQLAESTVNPEAMRVDSGMEKETLTTSS